MIKIYTSPSCSSCKKVKEWFTKKHIPFEEHNIFISSLDPIELREIISKSENGTDDIISTRSNVFKNNKIDLDSLTISQMIEFIRQNPSVLKRPIVVDDRHIEVGYNEDEITTFIPRVRRIVSDTCQKGACHRYEECEHVKSQQ